MSLNKMMDDFLAGKTFAVAGASKDRSKYGNKVLRCYQQHKMKVYALNPSAGEIEGLTTYPDLTTIPEKVDGVSIVTPPAITEKVVDQAIALGIKHLWIQPGAESAAAVKRAHDAGINVIAGGPCILVRLGYSDH
jgi:predicted CoA-binding protein